MDFIRSDFLQNPYFNKFENLIFKNSNPWSVEQKIDLGFQKHLKGGKLCCYLKKKASAMKKCAYLACTVLCINVGPRPHGLETRVIIKISTNPCNPRTFDCFALD